MASGKWDDRVIAMKRTTAVTADDHGKRRLASIASNVTTLEQNREAFYLMIAGGGSPGKFHRSSQILFGFARTVCSGVLNQSPRKWKKRQEAIFAPPMNA
jgi:hypothetical protein